MEIEILGKERGDSIGIGSKKGILSRSFSLSADNFVSTSNWIGDSYNENIMNGRCMKRDR